MDYIKITVQTPRNQAHKCIKSQRDQLLGMRKSNAITKSKVTKHNEFYWILPYKDDDELSNITKRLALGETMIKAFYQKLFKAIKWVNRIAHKTGKTGAYLRRQFIRYFKAKYQLDDQQSLKEFINGQAINDTITIDDQTEMDKLLKNPLFHLEQLHTQEEEPNQDQSKSS